MLVLMKSVTVVEVVSPGCQICHVVEDWWESHKNECPNVSFRRVDVVTPEGTELAQKYLILASPGIIINDEIFSVGGFDPSKFTDKLKEVSKD